jgi:hypothetical protein
MVGRSLGVDNSSCLPPMDLSTHKGEIMTVNDFILRCNENGIIFSESAIRMLVTYQEDQGMDPFQALHALITRR